MILASLLLPMAVAAIVFLVQRVRLPVFLAIMGTVVVYGIAADMTFQSVGKAFGLGFTAAMEQTGLLIVAGALVGWCCARRSAPAPRPPRAWWRDWAPRLRAGWRSCSRPGRTPRGARWAWRSPCSRSRP
jgi:hypothetical protein